MKSTDIIERFFKTKIESQINFKPSNAFSIMHSAQVVVCEESELDKEVPETIYLINRFIPSDSYIKISTKDFKTEMVAELPDGEYVIITTRKALAGFILTYPDSHPNINVDAQSTIVVDNEGKLIFKYGNYDPNAGVSVLFSYDTNYSATFYDAKAFFNLQKSRESDGIEKYPVELESNQALVMIGLELLPSEYNQNPMDWDTAIKNITKIFTDTSGAALTELDRFPGWINS